MSIEWFRSWHGAPTDNKWLLIAKRAGVPAGMVSAVVWALFDHASQNNDRGNVEAFDIETYAIYSGFEEEKIAAIINALKEKSVIISGCLSAWQKRQPKREDNSSDRVREHRNAVKRDVTQCNATERSETQCNSREDKEESREREEIQEAREAALCAVVSPDWPPDYRTQFWERYPHKVGKPAAFIKLERIRRRGGTRWLDLFAGLDAYIREKPIDRPWLNPATFLNQERWADQPAAKVVPLRRVPDV